MIEAMSGNGNTFARGLYLFATGSFVACNIMRFYYSAY